MDTVEQTAQIVFRVATVMELEGQTTPDNGEAHILQSIAPLCPWQYGSAVYVARALLNPIDSTDYYNSCEDIVGSIHGGHRPIRKKPNQQKTNTDSKIGVLVYPNPASTLLNVALYANPGSRGELQGKTEQIYLYNQVGELVLKLQLNNTLTVISISSLAPGIYHYRITDNQNEVIKAANVLIVR